MNPHTIGGLTRGSTRREAEFRARRPSRLDSAETRGVTPLASRTSKAGQRRAALPAGA